MRPHSQSKLTMLLSDNFDMLSLVDTSFTTK